MGLGLHWDSGPFLCQAVGSGSAVLKVVLLGPG